jgi:hypothetical protein
MRGGEELVVPFDRTRCKLQVRRTIGTVLAFAVLCATLTVESGERFDEES